MTKRIEYIIDEILDQYMYADLTFRPWIIGFSGGKDSTVLLTLVWLYNRQIHLYSFFNSDVQKMFFWPIKKHLKIV